MQTHPALCGNPEAVRMALQKPAKRTARPRAVSIADALATLEAAGYTVSPPAMVA